MTGKENTRGRRPAAMAAVLALSCLAVCTPGARAQKHQSQPHPPPQHHSAPAPRPQNHPQQPARPSMQAPRPYTGPPKSYATTPPANRYVPQGAPAPTYTHPERPAGSTPNAQVRAPYPGETYPGSQNLRPAYSGNMGLSAPPGHLQ